MKTHDTRKTRGSVTRRLAVGVAAASLAVGVAACGDSSDDSTDPAAADGGEQVKIAVLLPGPRDEVGSSKLVADGVEAAAESAGAEVSISDSVPPAEAPQVLETLAEQGNEIIVANGAENLAPAEQVAPQFPDTKFIVWFGGPTDVPNIMSAGYAPRDTGYMAGAAAALMTKTDKVGVVTGAKEPTYDIVYEGFQDGAAAANPDAEARDIVSGDYFDAQKNTEAAQALIDDDYDALTGYLDAAQPVVARLMQKQGSYYVGLLSDLHDAAPDAVVTSFETEDAKVVEALVTEAINGEFQGGQQVYKGLADGFGKFGTFGSFVPESVEQRLEEIKEEYIAAESE